MLLTLSLIALGLLFFALFAAAIRWFKKHLIICSSHVLSLPAFYCRV